MTMLNQVTALGDIADVEAFVIYTIGRARGLVLTEDQRDELICHGFVELVRLHNAYDPAKASVPFSVYANTTLPLRLSNVWKRKMNEHISTTTINGQRTDIYFQPPDSWDQKITRHFDSETDHVVALEDTMRTPGNFTPIPQQKQAA